MKIIGANLGQEEGEYNKLSHYLWTDDKDIEKIIINLENMYLGFLNKFDSPVIDFPIDENGKAKIVPGMVNHRCDNSLDSLSNISKYGILASEWFGIPESEREGCFCAFVSRMKPESYKILGSMGEDNHSRLNIGRNVILFFDDTNPVMKYLLHLDYFEYEKIKQEDKSKLNELYTKEEIELFDKLIEPFSPAGKNMRKPYDFSVNYWSAIPGGIPSFLVNGICIKKNNYTEEELDKISEMFPNATIFKNDLEVVRYPKKDINNKSI